MGRDTDRMSRRQQEGPQDRPATLGRAGLAFSGDLVALSFQGLPWGKGL